MTPAALDTRDLLAYNAKHGVLICRECKYAVQKNAVGSHLLRHKVYRRERQRLLSAIARLELLEPGDVQLPSAGSLPVEGLPIVSGYRCTATACEHLCASAKRMRRHWSEVHGERNPPVTFSSPVLLQTFFRGTKLRYFEVRSESEPSTDTAGTLSPPLTENHIELIASAPAHSSQRSIPRRPLHQSIPDLETLRYFHHFTTKTSPTLPNAESCTSTYWAVDVVAQALQSRWLMSGLLAISASHAGTLSDEGLVTHRTHFERSAQFSQDFFAGWGEAKRESGSAQVEGAKAGAQIACILRCCYWLSETSALTPDSAAAVVPFQLRLFIRTVRGCSDADFALRSAAGSEDTPDEEEASIRADTGKGAGSGADVIAVDINAAAPPTRVQRLRSLPSRMLGPLGKPDSALDFFATLAAIDTLVECCSLSYASDDMGTVWMGMESWLRRIPAHFHQMVWRRCPAGLVVLAQWSLLVERAERHYWFLKGSAANVRRQCSRELPGDDGIQGLINDLAE